MSNLRELGACFTWEAAHSFVQAQRGTAAPRLSHASREASSADLAAVERESTAIRTLPGPVWRTVLDGGVDPKLTNCFQTSAPSSPASDNEASPNAMHSSSASRRTPQITDQRQQHLRYDEVDEKRGGVERRASGAMDPFDHNEDGFESWGAGASPLINSSLSSAIAQGKCPWTGARFCLCGLHRPSVSDILVPEFLAVLRRTGTTSLRALEDLSIESRLSRAASLTRSIEVILTHFTEREHGEWGAAMSALYIRKSARVSVSEFSMSATLDVANAAERTYRSNVEELVGFASEASTELAIPSIATEFAWVAGKADDVAICGCCPNALRTCLSTARFEDAVMGVLDADGRREFARLRYYNGALTDAYEVYVRNRRTIGAYNSADRYSS
jgi:hypothetical protein